MYGTTWAWVQIFSKGHLGHPTPHTGLPNRLKSTPKIIPVYASCFALIRLPCNPPPGATWGLGGRNNFSHPIKYMIALDWPETWEALSAGWIASRDAEGSGTPRLDPDSWRDNICREPKQLGVKNKWLNLKDAKISAFRQIKKKLK